MVVPRELYYLDDNFSVRSLRKYQLKEILTAHNIPYLQSITRNDLINLFKKHVEPKREEILAAYRKQQEQESRSIEEKEELGRGHRTIHKPVKFENELEYYYGQAHKKDKDGFVIPAKPKHVRFNPEDSFDDSEVEPLNQSKLSNTKTKVKKETNTLRKSVKKPTTPLNKKTTVTTTTTTTTANTKPSKKTIKHFNPEDSFASSGDEEDYSIDQDDEMSYSTPIKQEDEPEEVITITTQQDEDDEDPDYDADADLTDDEDEDLGDVEREELVMLYKDQSVPAESLASSAYPIKTRAQRLIEAKQKYALWINRLKQIGYIFGSLCLMIVLLGLNITANARQKNGYCSNQETLVRKNVSSVLSMLPSPCIPCPDHGTCIDGELQCDTLYERKTPFYNPYGVFPLADDCIHNSVLGRYVAKVERRIKRQLAVKQGEIACAHLLAHADSDTSTPVPVARVLVKDLLTDIKTSVEPYLPADRTEEIMIIALSAVLEDPQIHYWEIDDKKYLGTDAAEYSTMCQIKRLYKGVPLKIKVYIVLAISILSAIYGASRDYKKNIKYQKKINQLVKSTLDQLKDQHEKHTQDSVLHPSPTLPVSQLRLAVVDVNNKKTIEDWHRVVEKIESNPHVRKSFKEVRGDPVEHWELIV